MQKEGLRSRSCRLGADCHFKERTRVTDGTERLTCPLETTQRVPCLEYGRAAGYVSLSHALPRGDKWPIGDEVGEKAVSVNDPTADGWRALISGGRMIDAPRTTSREIRPLDPNDSSRVLKK